MPANGITLCIADGETEIKKSALAGRQYPAINYRMRFPTTGHLRDRRTSKPALAPIQDFYRVSIKRVPAPAGSA